MTQPRLSNRIQLTAFVILSTLIISVERTVVHSPAFERHPVGISLAVLFDLIVVTTALFYWLVARPFRLSVSRVGLVALLMVRIALFILPETAQLPGQLWPLLLGLVEGAVLVVIGVRIRTIVRTYRQVRPTTDAETALRMSLSPIFGDRIAGFIISEGLVVYYALLGWRLRSVSPEEGETLTTHHQSGQVVLTITLVIVGLVECVVVHILLTHWNPTVAIWLTVISGYGLLFFVADAVATVKRPSYLTATHLHLRMGVRWQAVISRGMIDQISLIHEKPAKQMGRLNGAFLTAPNVLLTFTESILFQGPYGIQREVREFSFFIDDREGFSQQLQLMPNR